MTFPLFPSAETPPQDTSSFEAGARKQIEIQSACDWNADRKKILEALCLRLKKNILSRRFYIGPYRICPITKIFMRKPSGSFVTYRVSLSSTLCVKSRTCGTDCGMKLSSNVVFVLIKTNVLLCSSVF